MRNMKKPKQRNPIARELRSPLFRQRVVQSAKTYKRKRRDNRLQESD